MFLMKTDNHDISVIVFKVYARGKTRRAIEEKV